MVVDTLIKNVIIVLMEKCERHCVGSLAEGQIKELGSSQVQASRGTL